jgi:hypothetical protein
MPRSLLVLAIAFGLLMPAQAKDKDKEAEAQVRVALTKYLAVRYQGAPFKEYAPLVLWSADQEPACTTAIASYAISDVRLKDKDTAIGTVAFYELGSYCPETDAFQSAPHLESVLFQLRHRSILWLVDKTNRPGGQVDWHVVRDWLRLRAVDASLAPAQRGRARMGQLALERLAKSLGRNGND